MKIFKYSIRQARREWRSGELRALAAALAVAAAAMAAVGSFTERIEKALRASANELLAADLVVASRRIPAADWGEQAAARDIATTTTVEFPSVAFSGDASMLVQVKAVAAGYPLRGKLKISDAPFAPAREAGGIPEPGTVWVDPRLLGELQLAVGDPLELGELTFTVARVIALEPDRASGVFNLAPRVMMNLEQLEPAGLVGSGSRVRYRFLIAGQAGAVEAFRDWLEPKLESGQFFQSLEDTQQQVGAALDRAQRFLSLAALTAVILAGVAIIIAVRRFVERHLDTVAILRCLGARQRPVMLSFVAQLVWLALPAISLGCVLGYLAQSLLVVGMGDLIPEQLPLPGPLPALAAAATGLLALLGYGVPPLLRLRTVPPVRVLNRQLGQPAPTHFLLYLAPVAFSLALILWQARDAKLGLLMAAGILASLALLAGAAALLVRSLKRLSHGRGVAWRFGLANVSKRGGGTLLQIAGIGLGMMVIFLLSVIQTELLRGWRDTLPADTPNFFLINIQPDQVDSTGRYLNEHGIVSQGLFPMAVARLTAINGEAPDPDDYDNPRARFRIEGNVNLSWSEELPAANRIIEGSWWGAERNQPLVSLAESWAEIFDLKVGDELSFAVGAEEVTARVASIREVDWDSFQVNFFILLSEGAVGEVPRTYISSLHVPEDRFDEVSGLVRMHPNVSVLDVGAILKRVRDIIERVSLTVQFVFGFTLLAGITVLLAALQSGLTERIYEGAVLRTLGGSRRQLRLAVLSEFSLLGGVAGLLAALAANLVGLVLADQVFNIVYQPAWWLLALGLILGAAGIGLTGLAGSQPVLRTPPVATLRRAA